MSKFSYYCYYCDQFMGYTNSNAFPLMHSCNNHDMTVYHFYTGKDQELRNIIMNYTVDSVEYEVFIPFKKLFFCSDTEISISVRKDNYMSEVYLGNRPRDFTPETYPILLKKILSLKAFL